MNNFIPHMKFPEPNQPSNQILHPLNQLLLAKILFTHTSFANLTAQTDGMVHCKYEVEYFDSSAVVVYTVTHKFIQLHHRPGLLFVDSVLQQFL